MRRPGPPKVALRLAGRGRARGGVVAGCAGQLLGGATGMEPGLARGGGANGGGARGAGGGGVGQDAGADLGSRAAASRGPGTDPPRRRPPLPP
eukprot:4429517-Pyramimonas_sp.AAC.1